MFSQRNSSESRAVPDRDTVGEWRCLDGRPELIKPIWGMLERYLHRAEVPTAAYAVSSAGTADGPCSGGDVTEVHGH